MKSARLRWSWLFAILSITQGMLGIINPLIIDSPALAEPITPASDGTGRYLMPNVPLSVAILRLMLVREVKEMAVG
ncbi:MAG: hypothetical protein RIE73_37790 [Coleofasciculus sp. C1-SOL-03]|uniref:hypothetical protein n=1 Tax=Coleofasciculus sp. C1-SOL-03 TaxID=3069522 RepID=UPI0033029E1D